MAFMRSLFQYYTQMTPLEIGGHAGWIDYRQKKSKFTRKHSGNGSLNGLKAKKPNFARKHWGNGFHEVLFLLLHTNHPLGKPAPHSLNRLQATNSEICMKPLSHWVWGLISIITHNRAAFWWFFLIFNLAFGRNTHWLVLMDSPSFSSWIEEVFGKEIQVLNFLLS